MPCAVIMAGGQGERFWPLTHARFPKYRLKVGSASLLQAAYRRLLSVFPKNNVFVVTTKDHVGFIREELPFLKKDHFIIEPARRNTAAALCLSSYHVGKRFGEKEVASFFPADHLIQSGARFKKDVARGVAAAKSSGRLVIYGIKPDFPATGYGYVEAGPSLGADVFRVRRFVEKPSLAKAKTYVRQKRFFWNAGIFTWKVDAFFGSMRRFAPNFLRRFDPKNTAASYSRLPNISIDYVLMEKTDNAVVVKSSMDWCDVGNWDRYFEKAGGKGAERPRGAFYGVDCARNFILNESARPLVACGLKDFIVIQTERGTLIAPRGRAEEAAVFYKHANANSRR